MKFIHYTTALEAYPLHPTLVRHIDKLPETLSELSHCMFYGPSGVGKYSLALHLTNRYSASNLKYEKQLTVSLSDGKAAVLKLSDVHLEVDMSMLGTNSKTLWHMIYCQMKDIVRARRSQQGSTQNAHGIIVCREFHCTPPELMVVFYSYMQQYQHHDDGAQIVLVLLTESLVSLPASVCARCVRVSVSRPAQMRMTQFRKHLGIHEHTANIDLSRPSNLKLVMCDGTEYTQWVQYTHNSIADAIVRFPNPQFFSHTRELLYELFVRSVNMGDWMWGVLVALVARNAIAPGQLGAVLDRAHSMFKLSVSDTRPIYHMERYVVALTSIVHSSVMA